MRHIFISVALLFLGNLYPCAQDNPNIKFGKISRSDFEINSPVLDSNSNAVVIADIGTCKFEGNEKGWFTLVFTEHKRIKLLNKNGFSEATIIIGLYRYGNSVEQIENLKASTYNFENGSVVQNNLDKKDIFDEKQSKNLLIKKFTFPGIKEGSIVEYSYTIKSDFFLHLHSWEFQGEYPCLWSSYTITVPSIFNYVILKQGAANYFINRSAEKNEVYNVTENPDQPYQGIQKIFAVNTTNIIKQWAMKDVPAMHSQDYVYSLKNYVSKVEFQLSEYRFPDELIENKMKDWNMVSTELLKYDDFGRAIADQNVWVQDELKNIQCDDLTDEQKARKIFTYIRDNYSCTRPSGVYLSEDMGLKDIIRKKNGSVSDLNLLLISILRKAGLNADPVVLSTRKNGVLHPRYPMVEKFNYIICQLKIANISYFLDASNPYLGFGRLQTKCYNGMARLISDRPEAIYLNPEDIRENKAIYIKLANNNAEISGDYNVIMGYNESLEAREKIFNHGQDDYFKEEEKQYPADFAIKNMVFDSLKNYEAPLSIKYQLNLKINDESLIYFNPMVSELLLKNPFKSEERLYPVELSYSYNTTYNFTMEIPKGYQVEELPKPQTILLPNNQAKFDYQILQFTDHIQLRCVLQLNKTYFDTDDYDNLRAFFSQIIKKENEQIVFKKLQ